MLQSQWTTTAVPYPQIGEVSFHTRLPQHSDPSPLWWASPQAPLTPDREARLGEGLPPFLTTKSSPAALVRSPPPTGHTRQPPFQLTAGCPLTFLQARALAARALAAFSRAGNAELAGSGAGTTCIWLKPGLVLIFYRSIHSTLSSVLSQIPTGFGN